MKRLAAFLILLLWSLTALAADFAAKVDGVSDSGALSVLVAGNRQVKVRLHNIDA